MTTAQYLQTSETVLPRELAFGVLRVADAPRTPHQRAVFRLARDLAEHVERERLGEVFVAPIDVILDADRALVVQPDIVFISTARQHLVTNRICGAPDVVIDVLSPHPRVGRIDERVGWFSRYGVRECWLCDLIDRSITVIELTASGIARRRLFRSEPIVSAVLPDFAGRFPRS